MKSQISRVQRAIEINGFVTISVDGRPRQARSVKEVNGEWITDIMTVDLCGYVRIKKTRAAVIAQADDIIARESEIRAQRAAQATAATNWMMQS